MPKPLDCSLGTPYSAGGLETNPGIGCQPSYLMSGGVGGAGAPGCGGPCGTGSGGPYCGLGGSGRGGGP